MDKYKCVECGSNDVEADGDTCDECFYEEAEEADEFEEEDDE